MKNILKAGVAAIALMMPLSANANDPPQFSFAPVIDWAYPDRTDCVQMPADLDMRFLGRAGHFPVYIGTFNKKDYYEGPVCIEVSDRIPENGYSMRYPTGNVFIWVWSRDARNVTTAEGFDVDCLNSTLQKTRAASGTTQDGVVASTQPFSDVEKPIGHQAPGVYAWSVCRTLDSFYPGKVFYPS